ncbi:MAG: protein kinase [Acidimicrobiia bacterium]|nr:protein kinase [Acidimicrobiia bacterium]
MNLRIHGLGEATEIGVGGSATVYSACRESDGEAVAVKVLNQTDPVFVERFRRERQVLTTLSRSPRIVTVHEAGTTEAGRPYLVLELCRSSLLDRINDEGPLDPREACRILAGIAEAVADAHLTGVVHRDIKPANILLSMAGEYLVADFGISTVIGSTTTETVAMAFTAGYVAPETLAGNPARAGADVYALGATLFHLITGAAPFTSADGEANIFAIANRVANEPVPDLRLDGVPDDVCQLIEAALAKDLARRPAAVELHRLLALAADGSDEPAPTPEAPYGPTVQPRPPASPPSAALTTPPSIPRYNNLVFVGRVEGGSVFTGIDTAEPEPGSGQDESTADRAVSIRVLDGREFDPAQRKAFRADRVALQSLSAHPRLAPLLDHGYTADGRPFDVSRVLGETTMQRIVADGGALPWPRMVEVGIMAASALEVLHREGFTHGNVVPSSLIVLDDGEVVLADYGAAARSQEATGADLDWRARDLRALGVTLLELAGVVAPASSRTDIATASHPLPNDWSTAIAASESLTHGPVSLLELLEALARFGDAPDQPARTAYAVTCSLHDLQVGLGISPTPLLVDPPVVAAPAVDQQWPPPVFDPSSTASATELSRPVSCAVSPFEGVAEQATATTDLSEAIAAAATSSCASGGPEPAGSGGVLGHGVGGADRAGSGAAARSTTAVRPGGRTLIVHAGDLVDRAEARARSMIGLLGGVLACLVLLGGVYLVVQRQAPRGGSDLAAPGSRTSTSALVAAIVPVVTDIDEVAASARIRNAGFEVEVTRAFDPEVPRGEVVSSTPASGSSAEIGTVVSLVVSRGSEPDCVGSTEQGVRRQLEDRNLALAGVTRSHSETVQAELVIRCVIYDATETAIIVVSDGPRADADG